jgi:hypothetical protein
MKKQTINKKGGFNSEPKSASLKKAPVKLNSVDKNAANIALEKARKNQAIQAAQAAQVDAKRKATNKKSAAMGSLGALALGVRAGIDEYNHRKKNK